MSEENIKKLRCKIDEYDLDILSLLNRRAEVAKEIGKEKGKINSATFHSPEREKELFDRLCSFNKGPLSNDIILSIYREIVSGMLSLEKPLKVAYLGPEGTFSYIAVIKRFGSSAVSVAKQNINTVFEEVEKGRAEYGVVPVENSIEGMVSRTLDVLIDSNLKICDEIFLPVTLNLASKCSDIKSIKKIYSHYQPIAQSRIWLDANLKNIEIFETNSTAKAAEISAKEENAAAICSDHAANIYGLDILAERIEDDSDNSTRFLIISKKERSITGSDKTSILIIVKDKPGALFGMLEPLAGQNINLTKIESRPIKKRPWEYIFFIDLDGHKDDSNVRDVISRLEKEASFIKILGSYPKG